MESKSSIWELLSVLKPWFQGNVIYHLNHHEYIFQSKHPAQSPALQGEAWQLEGLLRNSLSTSGWIERGAGAESHQGSYGGQVTECVVMWVCLKMRLPSWDPKCHFKGNNNDFISWREKATSFWDIAMSPHVCSSTNCVLVGWEAPFRWRHACLSELQDFLISEKKAGRYHPVISGGLDYN